MTLVDCGGGHYYENRGNTVQIFLNHSDAHEVYFLSSLDHFRLHPAERIDKNTWMVQVASDTEFRYFYIVDGSVYIPACRMTENDDFGSQNCLYVPGL